jgi:predicted nucleotidyltransferase
MLPGVPVNAPSFDDLLVRLVQADINFVLIGGLALGSWGVVRGTKDCDIVPDPRPKNLDGLARLAAELGGHIQLGESLLGSERSIASLLLQGERALIKTHLGDLDVVQGLEGVLSFAELRAKAIDVEISGVTIAICALEDLRAMKRAAGRARDLVDLEDLDAAQPD